MLTFLIVVINIVVMGFFGLCAIWDNDGTFTKLGPREIIWFVIITWVCGAMVGAL